MRRYTFSDIFKLLFSPVIIAPFLIGSLALAVAGNAIYDALQDRLGGDFPAHLFILFLAAIVLVAATAVFYFALALRSRERVVLLNKPQPAKRKGMIFLVSHPNTLQKAFEYHQSALKHCWLIATHESWNLATEFKEQHESSQLKIEVLQLKDEFDWEECMQIISGIFETLPAGLTNDDVITDFTGLTKLATAGAILASLTVDRPMQYVPGIYEEKGGKRSVIKTADPIEISIDRRIILNSFQPRRNDSQENA